MKRAGTPVAFLLAASLVSATFPMVAHAAQEPEAERSLSSSETVRSLLMNNWSDSIAIHYARQLYPADREFFGPYLAGLHNAVDWPMNQIDGATAFFRADVVDGDDRDVTGPERPPAACQASGEVTGDNIAADAAPPHSYPSVMCFDDAGILHVEYLREAERGLPIQIAKSYAMVPNQRFLVARYTLTNNIPPKDNQRVRVRLGEVVDLNNKTAAVDHEESADRLVDTGLHEPRPDQPPRDIRAGWRPELNAWIADMSAANGAFLVFGAFQDMDRHRAFDTVTDQLQFDRAIAPEIDTIGHPDLPQDVDERAGWDVGLSMWSEVLLDPGSTHQSDFFYAVTPSVEEAEEVARQAREPGTADAWFDQTESEYQTWIQQGRQVEAPDPGLSEAYERALVTTKQSQQPEFGSFVAATNPAYGFKAWPRDSSVTALGLAAAGHLDDAVKFYRWMASVQEDGSRELLPAGTWYSNYSYWQRKRPKHFVEPEWDSLGLFTIGVYHTWRLLNEHDPQAAREFLTGPLERLDQGPSSVYEAVSRAADFVEGNLTEHGFGPADHSIWEEDLEFATFTQVTYASGLNAAHLLATEMGEAERANTWLAAARQIRRAIERPASAEPCPGLWNDAEERWNRGTWPDCTPDDRLDAAGDLVWVFGLVDAADERVVSQRGAVLGRLTPGDDDIGITRYEGDTFYHEKPVSPGGPFEASAPMPSWPQMDMYVAMLEHWGGLDDLALQRLRWYASVTNVGYVPPGEAVDWPTDRPLPSTAAEPVTGTWFVMGLLGYLDLFDPRLPPVEPTPRPAP